MVVFKNYIATQGEVFDSTSALNTPVWYATDRSNGPGVGLILCSFDVLLRGISCLVLSCSLFSCFVLFAL